MSEKRLKRTREAYSPEDFLTKPKEPAKVGNSQEKDNDWQFVQDVLEGTTRRSKNGTRKPKS